MYAQAVRSMLEVIHWPHAARCEADVEDDRSQVSHTLHGTNIHVKHGSEKAARAAIAAFLGNPTGPGPDGACRSDDTPQGPQSRPFEVPLDQVPVRVRSRPADRDRGPGPGRGASDRVQVQVLERTVCGLDLGWAPPLRPDGDERPGWVPDPGLSDTVP